MSSGAVVDAHAHVFRALAPEYPRAVRELYPADAEVRAERLLARMRAARVDRAVLVAVSPNDRYARECARRSPDRFAAVAVHDPGRPSPAQVDERRADGYRGLRIETLGDPGESAVERLAAFPVLERMAATRMVAWFYGPLPQLRLLRRVAERLPGLALAVNHLGFCPGAGTGGDSLTALLELAHLPGVHVLLSGEYAYSAEAYPHADVAGRTRAVYESFGADRLMRASDFPWIDGDPGYGDTLALLDHHLPEIPARDRAAIAGGTALGLLWPSLRG